MEINLEYRKTPTKRVDALESAKLQHKTVQSFLNQEPYRTHLFEGLTDKKGESNKLMLLEELLFQKKPISYDYMQKIRQMEKASVSYAAKQINEYLEKYISNTIMPLKPKRIKIGLSKKDSKFELNL